MKKNKISTIIVFILCWACSDNGTNAPPPPPVEQQRDTITVSLEQTTHRSISVRLSKKLQVKSNYVLNRINGSDTLSFIIFLLSSADTLIIDDNDGTGLTIDTEYSYFAYRLDSTGTPRDTSTTLTTQTLAATSHDFTWTEYTPGTGELWDVWGTDENNVYAVGGITINDTLYGILHWDGIDWKPLKNSVGGFGIFGFSENDIWIASGGPIFNFNGSQWVEIHDEVFNDNNPFISLWGTSSENLYITSEKGKIIHWDGTKASVAFNTNGNHVGEIHGTSEDNIWASGNTEDQFSYVVHFNGKEWNTVEMPYNRLNAAAIYTLNARETFLAGNGMYFGYPGNFKEIEYPANIYIDEIDGSSSNDLFACGSFSLVIHYNGIEWKRLDPFPTEFGRLRGIYYSNNTVFIVGRGDNSVQILIGRK